MFSFSRKAVTCEHCNKVLPSRRVYEIHVQCYHDPSKYVRKGGNIACVGNYQDIAFSSDSYLICPLCHTFAVNTRHKLQSHMERDRHTKDTEQLGLIAKELLEKLTISREVGKSTSP